MLFKVEVKTVLLESGWESAWLLGNGGENVDLLFNSLVGLLALVSKCSNEWWRPLQCLQPFDLQNLVECPFLRQFRQRQILLASDIRLSMGSPMKLWQLYILWALELQNKQGLLKFDILDVMSTLREFIFWWKLLLLPLLLLLCCRVPSIFSSVWHHLPKNVDISSHDGIRLSGASSFHLLWVWTSSLLPIRNMSKQSAICSLLPRDWRARRCELTESLISLRLYAVADVTARRSNNSLMCAWKINLLLLNLAFNNCIALV